jgi:hypothetical protein
MQHNVGKTQTYLRRTGSVRSNNGCATQEIATDHESFDLRPSFLNSYLDYVPSLLLSQQLGTLDD